MKGLDPANVFLPYAIRYNKRLDRYQASPISTSEQITVTVDTIVYDSDSLLCVALLGIENNFTDIPPFEAKRKNGNFYDGRAIIGYRDSISSPFKIYPFTLYAIVGFDNLEEVYRSLESFYFTNIVGKTAPMGTNLEGDTYTMGLGDPDFFTKAPNFKRNEYGDFKFKYYLKGGEELLYNYIDIK